MSQGLPTDNGTPGTSITPPTGGRGILGFLSGIFAWTGAGQKTMAASAPVAIASDQSTIAVNLADVGGAAIALGQELMATSVPVVIASDQSILPTNTAEIGGAAYTLGQHVMAASAPVVIASDQSPIATDLTEVGGSVLALGQTLMASSVPVVIASDQSPISTELDKVGGSDIALGQTTMSASLPVTIASDQTDIDFNLAEVGGAAFALGPQAMAVALPVTIATDQTPVPGNIAEIGGAAYTLGSALSVASAPVVIASDQSTLPTNLTEVGGGAMTLGQKTMATSLPVVLASDQDSIPVLAAQGAPNAAANAWPVEQTDGAGTVIGTAASPTRIDPTGTTTQPVSAASLPLPTGAATSALQSDVQSAPGTPQTTALTIQGNAGGVPVPVSYTPAGTQDVDLTKVGGTAIAIGQAAMIASLPVVIAGDQSPITVQQASGSSLHVDVDNFPATQVVSGAVTGNQGSPNTAANSWPVEITDGTNILATAAHPMRTDPTGTTVQPVSATSLPLPTGASTAALQSDVQSAPGTPQTTAITVQGNAGGVPIPVSGTFAPSGTQDVNLTKVGGTALALGQTTMAASLPVAIASDQGAITVQQPTGSSLHVDVDNFPATQVVSGAVTANQGAANTVANAWPVEVTDGTNVLGTPAHPLRIDPTGTTAQPISVASLPLPTNAAQETGGNLATIATAQGAGGTGITEPAGGTGLLGWLSGIYKAVTGTLATSRTWVLGSGTDSVTTVPSGTQVVSGTVTSSQGAPNTPANSWSVEVTDGTNVLGVAAHPLRTDPTGATTQPVSAASLPLPTGAATAALQSDVQSAPGTPQTIAVTVQGNAFGVPIPVSGTFAPSGTQNVNLADVGGSAIAIGQGVMATSLPVVLASDQTAVTVQQSSGANLHVDVDNFPATQAVSGAVTANQGTPNTAANSWPVEITDGANVLGTAAHPLRNDPTGTTTQPISATALPLPAGAATAANQTDVASAPGTPQTTAITVQGNAGGVALPISASALPLPTGAATAANQVNVESAPGTPQTTSLTIQGNAAGIPVPVSGSISGTVTANQGAANTIANAWPVEVTDGANVLGTAAHPLRTDTTGTTTQPVSAAALPLPTNAAQETGGNLATIATAQGAGGTGITEPTGGSGLLGWLSGIYKALTGTLATSRTWTLASGTDSVTTVPSGTQTISGTVNQGTPNTAANSWPVEITDGTNVLGTAAHPLRIDPVGTTTQPVSAASLPLPTNAAQETGGNLATIATAQGAGGTGITQPAGGSGLQGWLSGIYKAVTGTLATSRTWTLASGTDSVTTVPSGTQVISGTVTANQGAANTAANSWAVEVTDGTNVLGTPTHPLRNDPTGTTTQPVSAASLPLPTGAATSALQTTGNTSLASIDGKLGSLGQKTMAASAPVVIASDQSAIAIQTLPAGTNLVGKVGIDQTTPGTTNGISVASIGATAVLAGSGATGTGSQRVTVATDSATVAGSATLPAGSNIIGAVAAAATGVATNAPNNATSAAYEASHVAKASAGILYGFCGFNSSTSSQFILVFDSASVPADGATAVIIIDVPAAQNFSYDPGIYGRKFTSGIAFSNSSTAPTKTIGAANCFFDVQYV